MNKKIYKKTSLKFSKKKHRNNKSKSKSKKKNNNKSKKKIYINYSKNKGGGDGDDSYWKALKEVGATHSEARENEQKEKNYKEIKRKKNFWYKTRIERDEKIIKFIIALFKYIKNKCKNNINDKDDIVNIIELITEYISIYNYKIFFDKSTTHHYYVQINDKEPKKLYNLIDVEKYLYQILNIIITKEILRDILNNKQLREFINLPTENIYKLNATISEYKKIKKKKKHILLRLDALISFKEELKEIYYYNTDILKDETVNNFIFKNNCDTIVNDIFNLLIIYIIKIIRNNLFYSPVNMTDDAINKLCNIIILLIKFINDNKMYLNINIENVDYGIPKTSFKIEIKDTIKKEITKTLTGNDQPSQAHPGNAPAPPPELPTDINDLIDYMMNLLVT